MAMLLRRHSSYLETQNVLPAQDFIPDPPVDVPKGDVAEVVEVPKVKSAKPVKTAPVVDEVAE